MQSRHDSRFPWGTLTVNNTGSLILGFVAGLSTSPVVTALVGTGFCGALTTYSTFSYETLRLTQDHAHLLVGLNIVISVIAGLAATYGGLSIALAA